MWRWIQQKSVAIFGALLVACLAALMGALYFYRGPDNALVLATPQDCLRVSDAVTCKALVEAALDIHARFAPRYPEMGLCELEYGSNQCQLVRMFGSDSFAPKIAVIVAPHGELTNTKTLLPLYDGSPDSGDDRSGRPVFFKGKAVGTLFSKRFGGAQISTMVDLNGKGVTNAWVTAQRKR